MPPCHADPRLELPGFPLHVTHRGVNRAATFLDDEDFDRYKQWLRESFEEQSIALHAYVLMSNHVHLLLTPPAAGKLSKAMSRLGQRYVPAFNRKHRRTGTLWEGRFKSCLVDSERYLLSVYRYIELNPLRAAMVDAPENYPWSSVHGNTGAAPDRLLTPHAAWLALGATAEEQYQVYRQWLRTGMAAEDLSAIRAHMEQERALGSPRFQVMVEKTLNRPAKCRPRGRPRSGEAAITAADV